MITEFLKTPSPVILKLLQQNQENSSLDQEVEDLVASLVFSMVSEPGDRMLGALAKFLGKGELLKVLTSEMQIPALVSTLRGLGHLEELEMLFGNLQVTLEESRQRWLPRLDYKKLLSLTETIANLNIQVIFPGQKCWPVGLDDLGFARPHLLFVEGKVASLAHLHQGVSIVGSRTMSHYGREVTKSILADLSKGNRPTVSGGALGVDSMVHQESLGCGLATVAVMAGGLDKKYPKANQNLFEAIKAHGAILSELPPGTSPTRWRFLQRNRLIAALTPTTIVVEANLRSGSISTANHALDLGRDLLAVPGSIFSPSSLGTNLLIAEGKAKPWHPGTPETTESEVIELSMLAKRAHDALRELKSASEFEIARVAGLTQWELAIALQELIQDQAIVRLQSSSSQGHYALRYAHST